MLFGIMLQRAFARMMRAARLHPPLSGLEQRPGSTKSERLVINNADFPFLWNGLAGACVC
jgi:hypothetical protein